jgi:predicted TIM-barrel fold metal-dependent hydrolase
MPNRSASSPSEDGSVAKPPLRLGQNVLGMDCHAHVFTRDLPLAAGRRYAPAYDASITDYLEMLRGNGMSHGVLVQPSFLGTDNSYLLEALRQAPDRLRGIVVVAPEIADGELQNLDRAGCAGIRLNLLGQSDPEFSSTGWQRHLQRLAALNWQVEVQAEARRLPGILPGLLSAGLNVVVDHFGRPSASAGVDDPGFRYLLTTGATRRVWVKLSGAYRIGRQGAGDRIACAAMPLLREAFGLDRLVWGSDWPHTQYEQHVTAAAARRSLDEWLPDPADRRTVLVETPSRLFRFGEQDPSLRSPCQSHTGSN